MHYSKSIIAIMNDSLTSEVITTVICGLIIALIVLNLSGINHPFHKSRAFRTIRMTMNILLSFGIITAGMLYFLPYTDIARRFSLSQVPLNKLTPLGAMGLQRILYSDFGVILNIVCLTCFVLFLYTVNNIHDTYPLIPSTWARHRKEILMIIFVVLTFFFISASISEWRDVDFVNEGISYRTNKVIHRKVQDIKPHNANQANFKWILTHYKGKHTAYDAHNAPDVNLYRLKAHSVY